MSRALFVRVGGNAVAMWYCCGISLRGFALGYGNRSPNGRVDKPLVVVVVVVRREVVVVAKPCFHKIVNVGLTSANSVGPPSNATFTVQTIACENILYYRILSKNKVPRRKLAHYQYRNTTMK
jgi:hypothetical protein